MSLFIWIPLIAFLAARSNAQSSSTTSAAPIPTPYENLPPPPKFADGAFTNPNTSYTQIFTEGAKINITWDTTYDAINLFFGVAGRGDYKFPITVTTGQSRPWYEFELRCRNDNCTLPHRFRAVDTYGTKQEHLSGGFTSGEFWIAPDDRNPATSSAVSSTTTPTSTSSSTSSTSASAGGGSSSNSTAIGVGVGVGVGVAALLLVGGLLFWMRRRKQRRSVRQELDSEPSREENYSHPEGERKPALHEGGGSQVYEVAAPNAVYEAPTMVKPSELPGSSPT